jgi:hypothetical protein
VEIQQLSLHEHGSPWRQDHSILRPGSLAILNHLNCGVNVLRRRPRNDRPILETRIIQRLPLTLDQLVALVLLEKDGLACAAEDHQTLDAAADEEEGVCSLRFDVNGWRA